MKNIISKRQRWAIIYILLMTFLVANYMRNWSFNAPFDKDAISRYEYRLDKKMVNSLFFEHFQELKQIRDEYPNISMKIQPANFLFYNERTQPLKINPEHDIKYPVLIISVDKENLPSLKQTMDKMDLKFSYFVLQN